VVAQASVPGQLQGIAQSQELGTDGLWAKLRGGASRVVLLLADSVTGLLWPPVVAEREDQAAPWQRLFERARQAGLDWHGLRGVTSDGAQGLSAFLHQALAWVQHQRCVFHIWRSLAGQWAHEAAQAAAAATTQMVEAVREQVRAELVALIHAVVDAKSYEQAEAALVTLRRHPQGAAIAQFLDAIGDQPGATGMPGRMSRGGHQRARLRKVRLLRNCGCPCVRPLIESAGRCKHWARCVGA
jgi:hypothetical protein